MSETKFTPGPWEARSRKGVGKNRNASSINGMQIHAAAGVHVASVTNVADKSIHQKEADAHLIAAAPDLYEALSDIVSFLRREAPGTPLNNHRFDAIGAKAYAALAKARGVSP